MPSGFSCTQSDTYSAWDSCYSNAISKVIPRKEIRVIREIRVLSKRYSARKYMFFCSYIKNKRLLSGCAFSVNTLTWVFCDIITYFFCMRLLPIQGVPFGAYATPGCRSSVALPWAVSFCLFEAIRFVI